MKSGSPILQLPVETLDRILEYVPDATILTTRKGRGPTGFVSTWTTSTTDAAMLIPFALVCRRFRDAVFSHSSVWTTLILGGKKTSPKHAARIAARSGNRLLNVVLYLGSAYDSWVHGVDMAMFWPQVADRIRELQIIFEYPPGPGPQATWPLIFETPCPRLESFAMNSNRWRVAFDRPYPLFHLSQTSALVHFCITDAKNLPKCHFSHLTHLAICGFGMREVYSSIVHVLTRTPKLQSLVLSRLDQLVGDLHYNTPLPLPALRRVVLDSLHPPAMLSNFISILPRHPQGYSLQILGITPLAQQNHIHQHLGPPLTQFIQQIETVYIGAGTRKEGTHGAIVDTSSIAGMTASTLVHLGTYLIRNHRHHSIADSLEWMSGILSDHALRLSVHDVWIGSIPASEAFHAFYAPVRDFIAALPALETVTIFVDRSKWPVEEPSVRFLPRADSDGRDTRFRSSASKLKTVRIVHGYDSAAARQKYVDDRAYGKLLVPHAPTRLRLSALLREMETGAFGYLDHLVLRVASFFEIDEGELDRLRTHFSTVRVEHMDTPRAMMFPLPDCAVEPESFPGLAWDGLFH
ncbi:hypothetical protein C8Q80DRAFT_1274171 [Daedaleopsis nitida]|nr:hypothetical protein C8Q80DRAFT_1274171 [Daedaleopsis nitida]